MPTAAAKTVVEKKLIGFTAPGLAALERLKIALDTTQTEVVNLTLIGHSEAHAFNPFVEQIIADYAATHGTQRRAAIESIISEYAYARPRRKAAKTPVQEPDYTAFEARINQALAAAQPATTPKHRPDA